MHKYSKYIKTSSILVIGIFFLMGDMPCECQPPPLNGYLIDSPIKGVDYYCDQEATVYKTDSQGKFTCDTNKSVLFKLGKLEIGQIDNIERGMEIYPQDLLGISRKDFTDERLVLLTRFLQSLDDDGNISKSINITKEVKDSFEISQFSDMSIEDIKISVKNVNKKLINEIDAITHLKKSLNKDNNFTNQERI